MEDIKWTRLEQVLNAFADEVIEKAKENLANNNTNATGQLSQSMDMDKDKRVNIEEDRFQVFIALEDYWKDIEYGTGPSHVKEGVDDFNVVHLGVQHSGEPRAQYWPPIDAIRNWVSNKPGVPKDDAFAYAVKGKIHRDGIEPKPFLEPAIEFVLPRYEDLINQAIEEDVSNFVLELVEKEMRDIFS